MSSDRVTVTLPSELLAAVDQRGGSRSAFVQRALRHELARLDREELRKSLAEPHTESRATAEEGLAAWSDSLPRDDDDLLDPAAGVAVHWIDGEGWVER
jgi:Arc/MetJ family transcription regulator